jgi:hypothetical protein
MAPEDGRVFVFFEQYHFAYTGLPFVDRTLDLFFVVSYAALLQSKTYRSDRECKPDYRKRCVVCRPSNTIIILVLKEYGIDYLLNGSCHVYTSMVIEHFAMALLAFVSMDSTH